VVAPNGVSRIMRSLKKRLKEGPSLGWQVCLLAGVNLQNEKGSRFWHFKQGVAAINLKERKKGGRS